MTDTDNQIRLAYDELESITWDLSGMASDAQLNADAARLGMTVTEYMMSDTECESVRDAAATIPVADLKKLEDRIYNVTIALHVAMGGEWYGEPIPELGVDGVEAQR
jgi:hypothetical protein